MKALNKKLNHKLNKTVNLISLAVLAALAGCNGNDGTNGENGAQGSSSLLSQTVVNVGHEQCLNGGVQIDSGLDTDSSGTVSYTHLTLPTSDLV